MWLNHVVYILEWMILNVNIVLNSEIIHHYKNVCMSQMNPKKILHNTTFIQFNYQTLPVTPFNP